MTTKITKTIKKSTRKKKSVIKKPKPIETAFFGTEYEKKILDICTENKFPLHFRRAKIKGKVVDFVNRDKRLIIEVYNFKRDWEEVEARLKVFLVQRFRTKYITRDRLVGRDWKTSCTQLIKTFLK